MPRCDAPRWQQDVNAGHEAKSLLDHQASGLDRQQQTRSLPRVARRVGGGVRAQRLLQQAAKEVEVEAERDRHRQGEQPSLSHAQAAAARAGERLAVDVQHHGYGRDPPQRKGEEEEAGAEQLGPRAEEVHLWREQKEYSVESMGVSPDKVRLARVTVWRGSKVRLAIGQRSKVRLAKGAP